LRSIRCRPFFNERKRPPGSTTRRSAGRHVARRANGSIFRDGRAFPHARSTTLLLKHRPAAAKTVTHSGSVPPAPSTRVVFTTPSVPHWFCNPNRGAAHGNVRDAVPLKLPPCVSGPRSGVHARRHKDVPAAGDTGVGAVGAGVDFVLFGKVGICEEGGKRVRGEVHPRCRSGMQVACEEGIAASLRASSIHISSRERHREAHLEAPPCRPIAVLEVLPNARKTRQGAGAGAAVERATQGGVGAGARAPRRQQTSI
jgi:hypothetical protein